MSGGNCPGGNCPGGNCPRTYNYMSIYIGNDLEDRLEALEAENASLRKYNEYHQVVHEIDHMSDLHVDSSFYKQSMKLDNYFKINKWIDFSIGQSTVLQELNKKRPRYPIQTKRKIGEGMLTLKTVHISFVALTSIVRRRLFALSSD